MMGLHLYADGHTAPLLADWLSGTCGICASDVTSCISLQPDKALHAFTVRHGIGLIENIEKVPADDAILVAGADLDQRIARLFQSGRSNLYNGNAAIEGASAARRFAACAQSLFVGPVPAVGLDPGAREAARFNTGSLKAQDIPRHKLFIVNSMPKSGTLWMAGLLERALGVKTGEQIVISHVADIEVDWGKYNNHGAVALVRDLRDVVVSWFHNAIRTDLELGYRTPRYPDLHSFYREFFLATIKTSDRYYRGDLVHWIDKCCASYVPLVRYEDMHEAPLAALEKVLNAWRIDYEAKEAEKACHDMSFQTLRQANHEDGGYLGTMFRAGHLRRGEPGAWRSELPADIARDIDQRFSDYQTRLGYLPAAG